MKRKFELTEMQKRVLDYNQDGLTQKEIAKIIDRHTSLVNHILKACERKGWDVRKYYKPYKNVKVTFENTGG